MKQHYLDRAEQVEQEREPRHADRVTLITRSLVPGIERVEAYYGTPTVKTVTIEIHTTTPHRAFTSACLVRPCYRPGPNEPLTVKQAREQVAAWLALPVKSASTRAGYTRAEILIKP